MYRLLIFKNPIDLYRDNRTGKFPSASKFGVAGSICCTMVRPTLGPAGTKIYT
jgi:hypothetical protein